MKKLYKRKINKIGILGGTFDPPHEGHLYISKVAVKKLNLDKLIWIVTKQNPFKKKPYLNINDRMKLVSKIIKKEKKFYVQYLDNKIKSRNTFDLLNYVKKKNLEKKLYFIIGADNFKKFHKWYKWEKIPYLAKIVVFPRKGYSAKSANYIAAKKLNKKDWQYIKSKKVNISSSIIRKFW